MDFLSILRDRAALLAAVRRFFAERKVMEVDCSILHPQASVDAHIDLIPALYSGKERLYLHSSPEYGMKKLLSRGIGDIYQLSHVFRAGEKGRWHNPEFTMIEWYRIGFSFSKMMEETLALIALFLGEKPSRYLTYRQAFRDYAQIDPFHASLEEIQQRAQKQENDRDTLLHHILAQHVEPHLGQEEYTLLTHYPASQAALAQVIDMDEYPVAERFEVYWQGSELANGYHELIDPTEQRHRLEEENRKREALGKERYPIDESFICALEEGIPPCCGVAVGFDRLLQLRLNLPRVQDGQP